MSCNPQDDPHWVELRSSQVGMNFLRTEVETALLFASLAFQARDSEKRRRNLQNARKGYDTLRQLVRKLVLTPDERTEMRLKISEVRRQLITLGESV